MTEGKIGNTFTYNIERIQLKYIEILIPQNDRFLCSVNVSIEKDLIATYI